ncbi:regulator of protease activity HflC (stomatin/prohibitin superfamily) [Thermocatellispora tengchongensis]|uniref:Regulator of protease activity HflC (Stomatin/prohibitin superfamily) n=1 Tax=Thermocatellispora tengchongensis TaxID=1073253 RepID=A0A840P9F6_9ACTN|nr:SPFH domain-containing protein [Thermocatellispora tengchongensis]MBB5134481.1 regulator of protease activity HflC (stomatin/prohibitin superfamily) [Thermocatellispora tengchongensis]
MADATGGIAIEGTAVEMPAPTTRERQVRATSGFMMLGVSTVLVLAGIALFVVSIATLASGAGQGGVWLMVVSFLMIIAGVVLACGLTAVAPGEARVVQLLGRYVGTLRTPGLQWVNPITVRRRVSTRIRNHETDVTKVNDADGNPIQIATVVVWQVQDTAQAVFEVDDFVEFVAIQAETAVRHIAGLYPYDSHGEPRLSLRDNAEEINEKLSAEISARVASAGVKVIESRIIHLAYAPEIAHAMLRRQQAGAVVAARQRIVEGAVGMVEMALDRLAEHDVVELDEERKAAMVSNLLVVLVGDRDTQPVVNTGTLYQ